MSQHRVFVEDAVSAYEGSIKDRTMEPSWIRHRSWRRVQSTRKMEAMLAETTTSWIDVTSFGDTTRTYVLSREFTVSR